MTSPGSSTVKLGLLDRSFVDKPMSPQGTTYVSPGHRPVEWITGKLENPERASQSVSARRTLQIQSLSTRAEDWIKESQGVSPIAPQKNFEEPQAVGGWGQIAGKVVPRRRTPLAICPQRG